MKKHKQKPATRHSHHTTTDEKNSFFRPNKTSLHQSISGAKHNSIQRDGGEKWAQIKNVGPYDAWTAKKDADRARRVAKLTGLPGAWNGPRDAFRHAYWNCLMTRSIGGSQAKTVADTHEQFGKNHPNEKTMDDHNNSWGRIAGYKVEKSDDCAKKIFEYIEKGYLYMIPNYEEVQKSRGRIPPKKPVSFKMADLSKKSTEEFKYGKTGYGANNYN